MIIRLFVVLFSLAGAASAVEIEGRLFFTPTQRAQLDLLRAQKVRQPPQASEDESAAAPAPEVITYGGIVRRSDGKSTVWLNDRPISDRAKAADAGIGRLRNDGAIMLKPPQAERSVPLKVGQSLEVVSGVIEEPYARRLTRSLPAARPAAKPSTTAVADPAAPAAISRGKPALRRDTTESNPDSGAAPERGTGK